MENTAKTKSSPVFGWFSPDQALAAFSARFLEKKACTYWVVTQLHPRRPVCPYCRQPITGTRRLQRFFFSQRLACKDCKRFFTATTGTILAGSHLGYRRFFLMSAMVAAGLDNNQVAAAVGCNPETVRLWRRKFESLAEINGDRK